METEILLNNILARMAHNKMALPSQAGGYYEWFWGEKLTKVAASIVGDPRKLA